MDWVEHAIWWQVYPLGFCGAPIRNPDMTPSPRLRGLIDWVDYAVELGPLDCCWGRSSPPNPTGTTPWTSSASTRDWAGTKISMLSPRPANNAACGFSWTACSVMSGPITPTS